MTELIRTFVGIPVPRRLGLAIRELQERIEKKAPNYVRWSIIEGMHITLYFMGENTEEAAHKAADAMGELNCKRFELKPGRVIALPRLEVPRVIAIEMEGQTGLLSELQAQVSEAISPYVSHHETKKFLPHLTFGRIKRDTPGPARVLTDALKSARLAPYGSFSVDAFELIESHLLPSGAHYEPLREYPLN